MEYLFSQWKCKQRREKMKIFREQTDPTQLNAARNACPTTDGESCRLRSRHVGVVTCTPLSPPGPLQPVTRPASQGSPGPREADGDLMGFASQFKAPAGLGDDSSRALRRLESVPLRSPLTLLTEAQPTGTPLTEPRVSPSDHQRPSWRG